MESTKTYNRFWKRKEWRNSQGQWHRENDLPAIEYDNGDKIWYLCGRLHRENGPAVKRACGYKFWYLNGQRHRVDGPAIIYSDGSIEYYEHGVRIQSEEDRQKAKKIRQEKEIARLEEASTKI